MKAVIATDVVFILIVIGLIVGAGLVIFWKWLDFLNIQANEISCRMKQSNYCMDLIAGKNPNWDDIPPKEGCEKYVTQPTLEECKK